MRTLAVTRPVGHGSDTESLIRRHGWTPLVFHTVELKPRPGSLIVRELKETVSSGVPDWFVFMSPRGPNLLFKAFEGEAEPVESVLEGAHILAVGPKTSASLRLLGLRNVETPGDYSSEGVSNFLSKSAIRGKRVVLTRSSEASDQLETQLRAEGAFTTTLRLYDSSIPADHQTTSKFLDELVSGVITAVLFTSALSATNLFKMRDAGLEESDLRRLLGNCLVGAIGPITLALLKSLGIGKVLMPKRFLIEDAVDCLIETAEKNSSIVS